MTHIYSHCHLSRGNDMTLGMHFSWSNSSREVKVLYILIKNKRSPLYIYIYIYIISLVQIWYDTHLFTLPPVMWAWCDAGHAFHVKSRYICTVNSNNEHYIFSLFITGPWRTAGAKFGVSSKEWVFNSLAFCTESSLAFCAESSNSPLGGAGRVIVGTSSRISIVALLEYFGQGGRRNYQQRIYIYK